MPSPTTPALTAGFIRDVASDATTMAHSVPEGTAPLTATWKGALAREGCSGPAEVTINNPAMRISIAQTAKPGFR